MLRTFIVVLLLITFSTGQGPFYGGMSTMGFGGPMVYPSPPMSGGPFTGARPFYDQYRGGPSFGPPFMPEMRGFTPAGGPFPFQRRFFQPRTMFSSAGRFDSSVYPRRRQMTTSPGFSFSSSTGSGTLTGDRFTPRQFRSEATIPRRPDYTPSFDRRTFMQDFPRQSSGFRPPSTPFAPPFMAFGRFGGTPQFGYGDFLDRGRDMYSDRLDNRFDRMGDRVDSMNDMMDQRFDRRGDRFGHVNERLENRFDRFSDRLENVWDRRGDSWDTDRTGYSFDRVKEQMENVGDRMKNSWERFTDRINDRSDVIGDRRQDGFLENINDRMEDRFDFF